MSEEQNAKKKQFSVKMRCVVDKVVTVECNTIEEARADPWGLSVDEKEVGQHDWDILSVTEDK